MQFPQAQTLILRADLKYQQFYEAENQLLLADIGHFERKDLQKIILLIFLKKKNQ